MYHNDEEKYCGNSDVVFGSINSAIGHGGRFRRAAKRSGGYGYEN